MIVEMVQKMTEEMISKRVALKNRPIATDGVKNTVLPRLVRMRTIKLTRFFDEKHL